MAKLKREKWRLFVGAVIWGGNVEKTSLNAKLGRSSLVLQPYFL